MKPEKIDLILKEIQVMLERKNHDYGNSFEKLFRQFGMLSTIIRLSDKLERLISLERNQSHRVDESTIDTLYDLAGYCILTLELLDGE